MVKVTFNYEPDDPDTEDATGMSNDEYEDLTMRLMELGAEDIDIADLGDFEAEHVVRPKRKKK